MANPRDLPSTQMVFPKYPELPEEIRLMIIDEAIRVTRQEYWKVNSWETSKPFLFPLASVNYEWNRVIEMLLFNRVQITHSRLSKFAETCGKRHGRLNYIILSIDTTENHDGDQPEACVAAAIAQLFNIMKDWSHVDRERQGLLKVVLYSDNVLFDFPPVTGLNCNFGTLPKVPIIGSLYGTGFELVLHPSSSLRLYQSCPNIRHVTLGLPFLDNLGRSTEQASNAITSLASTQPGLTHLELAAGLHPSRQRHVQDAWMPAADCVAALSPSWTNNLVLLDVGQVDHLPSFLLEAGRSAWPNLKVMRLLGVVDTQNKSEDEIKATARGTCTALVRGLITMLRSMPNITTVIIRMPSSVNSLGSIRLGMRLGNLARIGDRYGAEDDHYWVKSCSYRFVPSYDNGVVLAAGTDFPGHLATELQHTVRRYQLKDLGVFFDSEESSTWGREHFRWQWNAEEQCWDLAFKEEADEFTYQMGRYFDSTQSM